MSLENKLSPAVAEALSDISAAEVHRLREETGDGMMMIKKRLTRENLAKAISVAETPDDFRAILTCLLDYTDL